MIEWIDFSCSLVFCVYINPVDNKNYIYGIIDWVNQGHSVGQPEPTYCDPKAWR